MDKNLVSWFLDGLKNVLLYINKDKPATYNLISTIDRIYKPKALKSIDERNKKLSNNN